MNYFKPTVFIKSFSNLNLFALRRSGIKLLICDLDNTISPHFARFPNRKAINFCKAVQNTGIKLAIVSNNTYKRVNNWVNRLKTEVTPDYVIPSAKKPLKRKVLKMIKHLGMKINETAIMGDQFVIDV
jgi:HAD superfamily phosphatase (TIGR01668 family)